MIEELPNPVLPLGYPKKEASGSTGDWSTEQPAIDYHKCTNCGICIIVCPESAIVLDPADEERRPKIDYNVCKGCQLCRHECAPHAMDEDI